MNSLACVLKTCHAPISKSHLPSRMYRSILVVSAVSSPSGGSMCPGNGNNVTLTEWEVKFD